MWTETDSHIQGKRSRSRLYKEGGGTWMRQLLVNDKWIQVRSGGLVVGEGKWKYVDNHRWWVVMAGCSSVW